MSYFMYVQQAAIFKYKLIYLKEHRTRLLIYFVLEMELYITSIAVFLAIMIFTIEC